MVSRWPMWLTATASSQSSRRRSEAVGKLLSCGLLLRLRSAKIGTYEVGWSEEGFGEARLPEVRLPEVGFEEVGSRLSRTLRDGRLVSFAPPTVGWREDAIIAPCPEAPKEFYDPLAWCSTIIDPFRLVTPKQ